MIMLPAKHETSIGFCGNSQHSVVQGFYQKYGAHNGIIGPGSHREKWVESLYFCQLCGVTFQPTLRNCLQYGEKERYENAKRLLEITFPGILKRTLQEGEVFKLLTANATKSSYLIQKQNIVNDFRENTPIRFFQESNMGQPIPISEPYIIPGSKPGEAKMVFWVPWEYENIPLSKKEREAIKKKARRVKNDTRNISKTALIEEKLMEGTSRIIKKKTEPLPKDAIPAIKIFLIWDHYGDIFYIPQDAYTAVK